LWSLQSHKLLCVCFETLKLVNFKAKPICGSEVWVVEDRIYGKRETEGYKLLELSLEFLVQCLSDFEVGSTTFLLRKQRSKNRVILRKAILPQTGLQSC
jgi:hypothetical protein